jgi:3'(2'), 5'-bisphosphate nucleotidase
VAGEGCWEIKNGERRTLRVSSPSSHTPIRVVRSRSHSSPKIEAILELMPQHEVLNRGSALKFCTVAAGEADFYPRFGPTWEWDTAAGQAIVTAAGGAMVSLKGEPFTYNKPNILNGPFLVTSSLSWLKETGILEITSTLDVT